MPANLTSPALIASELRDVLGHLLRKLRVGTTLPLMQGTVLARLDRCGPSSVSDLSAAEGVRPQSMAQTVAELEAGGLVLRRPDPDDGRRALVELTELGLETLSNERRQREGWLARGIDELSAREQEVLSEAVELLRRVAERQR